MMLGALSTGWLVPVLLLAIAPPTPAAPRSKAPAVKYGIPRVSPGQLWVSSIPAGLEVRIGKDPISGKVVGRTPVVVEAADVGRFVNVRLLKEDFGGTLPRQEDLGDFTARSTQSGTHRDGPTETDWFRGLTYEVNPKRQTVIALFQPRSLPLSSMARFYPPGSNFPFSDRAVSTRLAKKGAEARAIPEALRLLHRGGKVVLPAGSSWLVAEVTAPGVVDVIDLASVISALSTPTPSRTP
ncbi:MAG: hypothetical protein ABI610_13095 [Acidobacteriota bacterium]